MTKKLQPEDLREFEGKTFNIYGHVFKLYNSRDLGGEWVIWESTQYRVWATPNYEVDGVPISFRKAEDDTQQLLDDTYEGEVNSVLNYFDIVTRYIKQMLEQLEGLPEDKATDRLSFTLMGQYDSPSEIAHDLREIASAIEQGQLNGYSPVWTIRP